MGTPEIKSIFSIVKTGFALIITTLIFSGCLSQLMGEKDSSAGFNGSFEKTLHHLPLNWDICAADSYKKKFDFNFDSINFKDGKQSLKFTVNEVDTTNQIITGKPGLFRIINVNGGEDYKVSCWIKNNGCKYRIYISSLGKEINTADLPQPEAISNEWVYCQYIYSVPVTYTNIRFVLNILSPGEFWIDDIKIDKISE